MKKMFIAVIMVLLLVSFNSPSVKANDNQVSISVLKIDRVSYSENGNNFYVYSVNDTDGGFWVMEFAPLKGETLKQFEKRVKGRYLIVKYIGEPQYDDGIDIIGQYIW
ncbi:hypothetical protein BSK59_15610 [Paenibacillus odorifer]|uniref:hypothetical protein n=1 Tax=Paenibacillus odorifer TaxID=189426 RepID=UPI00096D8816|nr:hypothetical protein [Paenibacillus odorifer]OME54006.1 hypothetical protein BSK59_15610 [Paenibacillus odorifer]